MASYAHLNLDKENIYSWKYFIPEGAIFVLSFIFNPSDKKIIKENGARGYHLIYEASIHEIKKRLKDLNLSYRGVVNTLTRLLNLSEKELELAIMDDDSFFEKYSNDRILQKKEEWDYKVEMTFLGELPLLKELLGCIENTKARRIILDLSEILDTNKKSELRNVHYFQEDVSSNVRIDRKYLESAKASFSNKDFDFVYIQLIISLESAIKSYLEKKYRKILKTRKKFNINIDSMFKKLTLVSLINFSIVFLGRKKISKELIDELEKIYNKRNNIMHAKSRNFKTLEVAQAIRAVDKTIDIINKLN